MKQDLKFITPVSMECTKEQYKRDLKQPLEELGYEELNMYRVQPDCNTLQTNWNSIKQSNGLGIGYGGEVTERDFIDHYNPELFLALAAMTEGDTPIIGEYYICLKNIFYSKESSFTKGNIYKTNNLSSSGKATIWSNEDKNAEFVINGIIDYSYHFRKATKEELIQHFTKEDNFVLPEKWCVKASNKEEDDILIKWRGGDHTDGIGESYMVSDRYWENYSKKYTEITFEQFKKHVLKEETMKKNSRFPLKLDLKGAKKILAVACTTWKDKLTAKWQGLLLNDTIPISEDDYKAMRDACSSEQHLVLDEVFGKDTLSIEDGIANILLDGLGCYSSDAKRIAERIMNTYDVKSK